MTAWMVRAGRGGRNVDTFRDEGIVALGWSELGGLDGLDTREAILARMQAAYPSYSAQSAAMAAGMVHRFLNEMQQGDRVVTYDPGTRLYACGRIEGDPVHRPETTDESLSFRRGVVWDHETSRDDLDQAARNSLGSIATLFRVAPHAEAQLWPDAAAPRPAALRGDAKGEDATDQRTDLAEQASERVKDLILSLGHAEVERLVAGLLRAMGFQSRTSAPGPDRGIDVVASPDGFGLLEPRIVAEVKHRKGPMGAPDVRAFLGGRRAGDRALYVSTGGFTREARYEAERATVPTTLMDVEDLAVAIQDRYEAFDVESRTLLPLRRVYVPEGG